MPSLRPRRLGLPLAASLVVGATCALPAYEVTGSSTGAGGAGSSTGTGGATSSSSSSSTSGSSSGGQICTTGSDCATNNCANGVCCDTACTGTCVACTAAAKGAGDDGVCGPVAAGTDPDKQCPMQAQSTCGQAGGCNGAGACSLWPAGTGCGSGSCTNGVQTAPSTCDGSGTCAAGAMTPCAPYPCGATTCDITCATDSDCPATDFCMATSCVPKLAVGAACAATDQCQTGFCADGFCCNSACTGTCQACSAALTGGADGTCANETDGTDPKSQCAGETCCSGACADLATDPKNCFTCGNVCAATAPSTSTCTATGCLTTLAAGEDDSDRVAVDGTTVYWTNSNASGMVRSIPIGGGAATSLVTSINGPVGLALDANNVYFAVTSGNNLRSVPLGGGASTTLLSGLSTPTDVALDTSYVYWTQDVAMGSIMRCLKTACVPMVVAPAQDEPRHVATDGVNVYWADYVTGTVMQTPVGGGVLTTLASGQVEPSGVAIDAANVYFDTGDGTLRKVPIGGGTLTTLATGLSTPAGIVVDANNVYVPLKGNNTIVRVPIGGGAPVVLASGQSTPDGIAIDGTSVYWANDVAAGSVMKLTPK